MHAAAEAAGGTFAGVGQTRPAPDPADALADDGVVRATVTVRNPLGLHARPAAVLARMLAGFDAKVKVNGANGASVLALMKLGATRGARARRSRPRARRRPSARRRARRGGRGRVRRG